MRMCVDQDLPWHAYIGNLSRETGVAFTRAGRASDETDIAFAGEKWAFWVRFSVVEVMVVSMVAVLGRALVMAVSQLPRGCVLCAKKFALRGPMVFVSAKKFSQRAENTPISAFLGLLGELFRGWAARGAVLGELFLGLSGGEGCSANFVAHASTVATYHR